MAGNLIKHIYESEDTSGVMQKLKKYTRDCHYLTQDETKKRIKMYIDCDCDYRRTVAELDNGVTEKALRSSVSYANDALKRMVGEDIVEQVENGEHLAELLIDLARMPHKHPTLVEAWNRVPLYTYRGFDLNDCTKELTFFAVFSTSALRACFDSCNIDKLTYIKHLLDSPSGIERKKSLALHKWLNNVGKVTKQKVAEFLDEVNGLED